MDEEKTKQEIRELIDKYNKIVEEKRISKYNEEIDQEVYKLYGITEEEKKIIKESLK